MPRKGLDEPGNFNRTCGFMGLCRQRHKPGHPAGEIEGSWAIDKESGEMLSHITKKALPGYEKSGLQKGPGPPAATARLVRDFIGGKKQSRDTRTCWKSAFQKS